MTFVILNLFVAVVLDGFDGSAVGEEETIVQKCMDVWFRHDTDVDLVLKVEKVKKVAESGRPGRPELLAKKGRIVGGVGCPPNCRTSGKPRGSLGEAPTF